MLIFVRQDDFRPASAQGLRALILGLCMVVLTVAGPGSSAFARTEAACEGEAKSPVSDGEQAESVTIVRVCERTRANCMRHAYSVPHGSCAGDRTVSYSHHTSTRPHAAEHSDRNGFGGPLLR